MEIAAADPASVNPYQDLIVDGDRRRDIADLDLARSGAEGSTHDLRRR
jgi:hypothetical protein